MSCTCLARFCLVTVKGRWAVGGVHVRTCTCPVVACVGRLKASQLLIGLCVQSHGRVHTGVSQVNTSRPPPRSPDSGAWPASAEARARAPDSAAAATSAAALRRGSRRRVRAPPPPHPPAPPPRGQRGGPRSSPCGARRLASARPRLPPTGAAAGHRPRPQPGRLGPPPARRAGGPGPLRGRCPRCPEQSRRGAGCATSARRPRTLGP
mmetsp:Transcript_21027/g.70619  ORF Transcript_21027/g.70619 Transcript_21027/m.70619 type:complete len:208 (-) Transcript_21027:492-1115(-)